MNFIKDEEREIASNREEFASELRKIKLFNGESGKVVLDEKGIFHSGATVRVVE